MQRPALRKRNEVTKFIASRNLAVDFLHFKNHVDPICQEVFNPYSFPELAPVNSVICEQTFAWTNQHANIQAMNKERFNFFMLYLLELHNLNIEKRLHIEARPSSSKRQQKILDALQHNIEKTEPQQSSPLDITSALYYD